MRSRYEQFTYAISSIERHIQKIERDEMIKYGCKGAFAQYLAAMTHYPDGLTAAQRIAWLLNLESVAGDACSVLALSPQGIQLTNQVTLAGAADGGVTGHIAHRIHIDGEKDGVAA